MIALASFASITGLFFPCRPSTIRWRVGTIIVNSINRMSMGWALAHVALKRFKGISPFSANRNASASIVFEGLAIWAIASPFHRQPYAVLPTTRHAVDSASIASYFRAKAPATLTTARRENRGVNSRLSPALALAQPHRLAAIRSRETRENSPSPKGLACQVNQSAHVSYYAISEALNQVQGVA